MRQIYQEVKNFNPMQPFIYYLTLILQLVMATVAGFIGSWLHIPVSWLLGPLVIGIFFALIKKQSRPLPARLVTIGQVIIALGTAASFSLSSFQLAINYALPLLMCILVTGALSLLNSYLLWRWAGIERITGFLGAIPGASHSIVAMSEDMGADALVVAVLQYLRVILVVIIIPLIAGYFLPRESVSMTVETVVTGQSSIRSLGLNLIILSLFGGLGVIGGRWLRLPSGVFIGPLLTGLLAFWFFPYSLQFPKSLLKIGLLLIGLSIGLKFNWQVAFKLIKAVLLEAFLVIILIISCLGVGYEFHHLTNVDLMTAVLGSTPGGLMAVMGIVNDLGGDSGIVLAMQMTRMLLILLLTPLLTTYLLKNTVKNEDSSSLALEK